MGKSNITGGRRLMLLTIALCFGLFSAHAQRGSNDAGMLDVPFEFVGSIQKKVMDLNQRLTQQTEKYLKRMEKRENRLRKKLSRTDPEMAKRLPVGSSGYDSLARKLATDTGSAKLRPTGTYQPFVDSLRCSLLFLQAKAGSNDPKIQAALSQIQELQAKMQDADQIRQYVRERKEQIRQALGQYIHSVPGISDAYQDLNKDLYYYSQQVQEYRELLNDPDKLTKKAMSLLARLPAFQEFMKNNSQLASLFGLPGSSGSAANLAGLQTRDQISQMVQSQVSAGGSGGLSALQSNIQSAQSKMEGYVDKLDRYGSGGGDVDMPNFTPDHEKTKTFWRRLEFGANVQTTKSSYYYPALADIGLSMGYKLGSSMTTGVGASFKAGLGSGWDQISFTGRGLGLRSFIDAKMKGTFYISGGWEYNYTTPFQNVQQIKGLRYWSTSGLIGVSKIVSIKARAFKKTKVSLLWDFLSYSQQPRTQPLLFRVGYGF